jgi:hypothetical protein
LKRLNLSSPQYCIHINIKADRRVYVVQILYINTRIQIRINTLHILYINTHIQIHINTLHILYNVINYLFRSTVKESNIISCIERYFWRIKLH